MFHSFNFLLLTREWFALSCLSSSLPQPGSIAQFPYWVSQAKLGFFWVFFIFVWFGGVGFFWVFVLVFLSWFFCSCWVFCGFFVWVFCGWLGVFGWFCCCCLVGFCCPVPKSHGFQCFSLKYFVGSSTFLSYSVGSGADKHLRDSINIGPTFVYLFIPVVLQDWSVMFKNHVALLLFPKNPSRKPIIRKLFFGFLSIVYIKCSNSASVCLFYAFFSSCIILLPEMRLFIF